MGAQKTNNLYQTCQEMLCNYLGEHGMRLTTERQIVLNEMCQLPQPFTAAQLTEACRTDRISAGTVYNTLQLFLGAGFLHATNRQRGRTSVEYEIVTGGTTKMQVICIRCGRVTDLHDKAIYTLIKKKKYFNFNLQHFTLFVYGECKICSKSKNKKVK